MTHEMLLAEAKLDDIDKIAGSGKKSTDAMDMKTINRMTEADLDPVQRCINALKLWDDMLTRAKAAGGEWLLGGLEGYEMRKLSYVDLALFWKIRTHMPMLEEIGFDALV